MPKLIEYLPIVEFILNRKKSYEGGKEFAGDSYGVQLIVDRCTGRVLLMPNYDSVEMMMYNLKLDEWFVSERAMAELLASGEVDDDIY